MFNFTYSKKQTMKQLVKKNAYQKIHERKTKKRLNIFSKFGTYEKPPPGYVLITSPSLYRRQSFSPSKNKTIVKEHFINPFLDFCSQNNVPLLCIDLDYTFRGTTSILKDRLESVHNWIPVEFLVENPKSEYTQKLVKSFKNSIKELEKTNPTQIFSYKGISLWNLIKPTMNEILLEPYFPTYFHLLENVEEFLKETQPSVIIQTYEAGPYAKIFELAASKLNIKTIGIQHGAILSDTPDYFFNQIRTQQNPLGNIIPDKTLVFGNYYKKMLTEKSAYPQKSIDVFGHPEYFDIEEIKSKLDKKKLQSKFNWANKTIILVPLSFRFSYTANSPDRVLLNTLYEEINNNDDIIVLVRPHPGDKLNEKILQKNFPSKNFRLSTSSLIEDFIMSDIVLVFPISTISTEAIMFSKSIIFPDIIQNNRMIIDPIFQILTDNEIVTTSNKSNLIKIVNSVRNNESTQNLNHLEKEKIIRDLCDFKSKPLIQNYIKKSREVAT